MKERIDLAVEKYRLQPGDFLLVKVPERIAKSPSTVNQVRELVQKWAGPDIRVLVAPGWLDLEQYQPQQLQELGIKI